jgi:hypothetical protein
MRLVEALRYTLEGRGVIGSFHCLNPSGHTMALGSTYPPAEMGTVDATWGWGGGGCKSRQFVGLTTLPTSYI